jgi:hypothetical protein
MKLADRLRVLSTVDVYFARLVAGSAAILQTWDYVAREYQIYKFFQAGGEAMINQAFLLMHLRITGALLLAAISLWFRRAFAFYVSLFGAAWVLVEYARWYLWSRTVLANAEIANWPRGTPHAFGLGGATAWNAAVPLLTIALLLWQMKTLLVGARVYRNAAV